MKFIKNTYLNLNLLFKGLGLFFFFFFYFFWIEGYSQTIVASNPVIEEYFRRSQLLEENAHNFSMNLRPVDLGRKQFLEVWKGGNTSFSNTESRKSQNYFSLLPLRQSISFNSKRAYGWGNGPLLPNVGISSYTSTGLSAKWFIFRLQLAPEFVYLQNRLFKDILEIFLMRLTEHVFFTGALEIILKDLVTRLSAFFGGDSLSLQFNWVF